MNENKDVNQTVLSVSQLNQQVRILLDDVVGTVRVEGEISNLSIPRSGHAYFSLKDDNAQVRCAMFRQYRLRSPAELKDGDKVVATAQASLYEARGEYQLVVQHIENAGLGALQRAFDELKAKLLTEGLFDSAHKAPIPKAKHCIGVITSATGAVIHDICTTLERRNPLIKVKVWPVAVQGEAAVAEIVNALKAASSDTEVEAIIIGRGGGSLEDLWAFNTEPVARAMFDCQHPLVSAVGHETDVTIADFVADMRAPTPTAAAELVSTDQTVWRRNLVDLAKRLKSQYDRQFQQKQQQLDVASLALDRSMGWQIKQAEQGLLGLSNRLRHPKDRVKNAEERLDNLTTRMSKAINVAVKSESQALASLQSRLNPQIIANLHANLQKELSHSCEALDYAVNQQLKGKQSLFVEQVRALNALSPLATLERGYTITTDAQNKAIESATKVKTGDKLIVRFKDGQVQTTAD
ncbi:exodeoxyribonuclease VII large subunit [Salinibius halmophilus]|uniref:exodeoxyribonuclease VII large subunit n=1 Tax=Salinibius halmophilus TaxID=1853216 RepID=UPI0013149A42|nr:exodeoxyribonuclease VII large subunit [Salinibius halmophilus]